MRLHSSIRWSKILTISTTCTTICVSMPTTKTMHISTSHRYRLRRMISMNTPGLTSWICTTSEETCPWKKEKPRLIQRWELMVLVRERDQEQLLWLCQAKERSLLTASRFCNLSSCQCRGKESSLHCQWPTTPAFLMSTSRCGVVASTARLKQSFQLSQRQSRDLTCILERHLSTSTWWSMTQGM